MTWPPLPHCSPILQFSYSTFLFLPSPITELVLSLGSSLNLCLAHSNISLYISSLQTLFIPFYQISNKLKFPLTLKQQQKFPSSPINSTHVLFFFFFTIKVKLAVHCLLDVLNSDSCFNHHTMRSPLSTTMKPNFSEQFIMIISVFFLSLSNIRYC